MSDAYSADRRQTLARAWHKALWLTREQIFEEADALRLISRLAELRKWSQRPYLSDDALEVGPLVPIG